MFVLFCFYIYHTVQKSWFSFLFQPSDERELSSPIHRTEETFTADDDSVEFKSAKSGARLNRLAALASTINNWEDDLSHPTLVEIYF